MPAASALEQSVGAGAALVEGVLGGDGDSEGVGEALSSEGVTLGVSLEVNCGAGLLDAEPEAYTTPQSGPGRRQQCHTLTGASPGAVNSIA